MCRAPGASTFLLKPTMPKPPRATTHHHHCKHCIHLASVTTTTQRHRLHGVQPNRTRVRGSPATPGVVCRRDRAQAELPAHTHRKLAPCDQTQTVMIQREVEHSEPYEWRRVASHKPVTHPLGSLLEMRWLAGDPRFGLPTALLGGLTCSRRRADTAWQNRWPDRNDALRQPCR